MAASNSTTELIPATISALLIKSLFDYFVKLIQFFRARMKINYNSFVQIYPLYRFYDIFKDLDFIKFSAIFIVFITIFIYFRKRLGEKRNQIFICFLTNRP